MTDELKACCRLTELRPEGRRDFSLTLRVRTDRSLLEYMKVDWLHVTLRPATPEEVDEMDRSSGIEPVPWSE